MSDVTAPLTDDEILAMRRLLDANTTPERERELNRRARELEEAERRAEYEREIAASMERAARDPIAQELFRKARAQAEADHRAEIAKLREEAKLDTAAIAADKLRQGWELGMWVCRDCGVHTARIKRLAQGGIFLCEACHAKHRLRCDVCGAHDDRSIPTDFCPGDARFRCPKCLAAYAAQPLPKPHLVAGR